VPSASSSDYDYGLNEASVASLISTEYPALRGTVYFDLAASPTTPPSAVRTPSRTFHTPIHIPILPPRLPPPWKSIVFAEECYKSSLVSRILKIENRTSYSRRARQPHSNSLAKRLRGMSHRLNIDTLRIRMRVWLV
jgi:hypothetical protein